MPGVDPDAHALGSHADIKHQKADQFTATMMLRAPTNSRSTSAEDGFGKLSDRFVAGGDVILAATHARLAIDEFF
jgi:glycine cleavage system regulatory protein